jgi:hypothetical protein
LWLVTLAKDLPFTFLDHALRHGDSLVGLDFDQIKSFHWKPGKQLELCRKELESALDEAVALRQQIQKLALENGHARDKEKKILLGDAEDALRRVRIIADMIIGAYFSSTKDKEREKERARRLLRVTSWLEAGGEHWGERYEELEAFRKELQKQVQTIHWMVEFPEVFYAGRRDPLDNDGAEGPGYMDAVIGNPPFMGGGQLSGTFGEPYRDWLFVLHEGSHGNSDLVAHFFRRADSLLGEHGTIGLIATNTIAQGDTRTTGLQYLLKEGHVLYDATRSLLWPGEAAVAVALVHLAKGSPARDVPKRLDGRSSLDINSRLRPKPERPDPARLEANSDLSFLGAKIYGQGFLLTFEEREQLISKNRLNGERIFPYLGGEEVNTSPTQSFERYVIRFEEMSLEEAERWPDLMEIVRARVKPERDVLKDNPDGRRRKKYWWQFGRETPALDNAIAPLARCLVTAQVTKHLVFSFQPTTRVFSQKLFVFPLPSFPSFAVLQSRVHETWVRLLSSTLEERLNYSPTDCFETFPFPVIDPRTPILQLEQVGETLYESRACFMVETNQGLTDTYNLLKDHECNDERVVELRGLHEELDLAVLAAYGWDDIAVPRYTTTRTDHERDALERFEDEVIDRLFVLNDQRYQEERLRGLGNRALNEGASRKNKASVGEEQLAFEENP